MVEQQLRSNMDMSASPGAHSAAKPPRPTPPQGSPVFGLRESNARIQREDSMLKPSRLAPLVSTLCIPSATRVLGDDTWQTVHVLIEVRVARKSENTAGKGRTAFNVRSRARLIDRNLIAP